MGEPILEASKIPVISEEMPVQNLKLKAIDKEFTFTCVSMGNPHAITVVENVKEFDVEKYGKVLEINKAFPNKTNVEFIEIVDKQNIKMRVWERGAGETLACGTGVTAVAIAAHQINKTVSNSIKLEVLGGNLEVSFEKDGSSYKNVFLKGPAQFVFKGNITI